MWDCLASALHVRDTLIVLICTKMLTVTGIIDITKPQAKHATFNANVMTHQDSNTSH